MEKKINDLRLEAFINDRQKFGPIKYQLICESLLFDKDNISIIKKCGDLQSKLKSQNAKDPLSAAIKKILIMGNTQNMNTNENILTIVVPAWEIFESTKWQEIKKNSIFYKFVSECLQIQMNAHTINDFQSVIQQITTISLQLSINESKEIMKEQNKIKQKELILKLIEQQAEVNLGSFLTNFTTIEKDPSQAQGCVKIIIKKKENQMVCDQIFNKLTQLHQLDKNNQQSNEDNNPQINQNNLPIITLNSRVDKRSNGIIPSQEYNKLFQNTDRLKKIMELKQILDSKTQAITYHEIQRIYNIEDSKVILNEILVTLDLALSINVWDDALIKYCKSIEDDDNKKEQQFNILEICSSAIENIQLTQFSGKIQYYNFQDNNEQEKYRQFLTDKKNEFPMKYQYEIDNLGIQMFSDDLSANSNCYISISFNQQEQKLRGRIGQSIIDETDYLMRIYFVQTQEFEKTICTIMRLNDDYTKLLTKYNKQIFRCLMIAASSIVTSFMKMPIILEYLKKNKSLNTNIQLPKDNKQIVQLLTTIQKK